MIEALWKKKDKYKTKLSGFFFQDSYLLESSFNPEELSFVSLGVG